ncbi:MAG TPA: hypothetical protein VIK40_00910 [Geomonas sp.]
MHQLIQVPSEHEDKAVDSYSPQAPDDGFLSSNQLKWVLTALLVYFGGRLLFFAVAITPFVPPDEVSHLGRCLAFSRYLLLPVDTPDSFRFGLVTHIPFLYYWLMGKLVLLNFFGCSDLTFLRLLNVPFALGTVYFVWRLLRLVTEDRLTQVLVVVAMTNTLMFSFVSASVSYDNLANLLAAMAIYYLFAFLKNRSGTLLAVSIICQLAGCLTKNTFLPLVLVLNALLLVHEFRHLRIIPQALQGWLQASRRRGLAVTLAILIGLTLNVQLYGGNYLRYKTMDPEMFMVLPLEQALNYRLAARAYVLNQFKEGKISVQKAKELAVAYVNHPGDRSDTIALVEGYAYLENHREQMMGPLTYVAIWLLQMIGSTFGIKAHLGMLNYGFSFLPLAVLMLLTGVAFATRWRPRDWDTAWLPTYLAVIGAFYGAFLLYFNYGVYLENRDPGLTVAGRYILPVMGPIYVFSSYYLLLLFKRRNLRLGLFLAAALVFILSDFPFFLSRVTPEWFFWRLPK